MGVAARRVVGVGDVYFSDDWEAFAPRNAVTLRRMVAGEAGVVASAR